MTLPVFLYFLQILASNFLSQWAAYVLSLLTLPDAFFFQILITTFIVVGTHICMH